ncbi:MAG: SGNH/GDSL hydrolase family protein [Opitutaceae bacterium]|jgi:lysophospholipase L1-like esterase|nr:SGNH/GDSL hydrolase family protein [Opitutaceae bacterium]
MHHFHQRIREKALDATAAPVLTVAFGDSVTQGAMEYGRLAPDAVYHRLLQTRLEQHYPTTTFSTLNAGVGGSNAPQALARLDRDVIRHQPDLVLIAFGLNDSPGGPEKLAGFEAALTQTLATIREKTEADAILLTPPFMATRRNPARIHPRHLDFADSILRAQCDGALALYAEKIRDIARNTHTPCADIHAAWTRLRDTGADTDDWLANGLNHPDIRGHRLAADLLFQTILATTS